MMVDKDIETDRQKQCRYLEVDIYSKVEDEVILT
jgi:hypothetical protein